MSLTVANHSPNTIFRVQRSVLERPRAGFRDIHQKYSNSPPHNPVQSGPTEFMDSPQKVWYPTPTSVKIHMQYIYLKMCV